MSAKSKLTDCPQRELHTPTPSGYLAHGEWAEQKMKTHHQERCPGCGLWAIWVPGAASGENDERETG